MIRRAPRSPAVAVAVAAAGALLIAGCTGPSRGAHPGGPGGSSGPSRSSGTSRPARSSHPSAPGEPTSTATRSAALGRQSGGVPRFQHVVVVVEENHSYSAIIGDPSAPYLNSLATGGALFTRSVGVTHPSEPNYLALFSGSTQGLSSDSCPHSYATPNLGSALIAAGLTFAGYAESMPADGYTGCSAGAYARKHNPWVDFPAVPAASNLRFSRFPTDYRTLPTVSFVIPNLDDDMHDGTVAAGDSWLQARLGGYARWAMTHDSLLVVTWDEDDSASANHIATIFYGQPVRPGRYAEPISHYTVLRTLEQAYGLPATNAGAAPITDAWQ